MSADILSQVEPFRTLEEVMRWAFGRKPPAQLFTVVTQDEFTHDAVIQVSAEVFLVFDTT